ncbi:MAG: molybdopterin-guanine dinucleotide biosynthesis protein MobB [Sulfolobales archaeon]
MIKYVLKIVSLTSNSGKTYLGSKLVRSLKEKGYRVGVIKHCPHGISLEVKDTSKYLGVGADAVYASSDDLLISYVKPWVDDLKKVLELIDYPVVVVEGYRESAIGDTIGVVRDVNEFNELVLKGGVKVDVIVSDDDEVIKEAMDKGLKVFRFGGLDHLLSWVEGRALRTIIDSLPKKDCGLCGFSSCEAFSKAYLMGLNHYCVYVMRKVRLLIDGREVELNPFVEKVFLSIIEGLLKPLKGVPPKKGKVVVELSYG